MLTFLTPPEQIRQLAIFGLTLGLALGFMIFTVIVIMYATSWVVIAGYCLTTVLISDGSIASRMAQDEARKLRAKEDGASLGWRSRVMLTPQRN